MNMGFTLRRIIGSMLVSKETIKIPAKTVVEDLISRSGSATAESLSPFDGVYPKISKMLSNIDFEGSIIQMFDIQGDVDIDRIKPYPGAKNPKADQHQMLKARYRDFNPTEPYDAQYERKIENVDFSFIWSYIYNRWYNLTRDAKKGIREYSAEYRVARTYSEADDESDGYTEEKDLILDTDYEIFSAEAKQEAKEEIPFLLKRLHEKSKDCGVSIISLVRAFERGRITVELENQKKSYVSTIAPRHVLPEGVYEMHENGMLGKRYDSSANSTERRFRNAWSWLMQYTDSYREDVDTLLKDYEILGIDIKEEDPFVYNQEFIDSMVVTFVSSNEEYITRGSVARRDLGNSLIPSVYKTLGDLPLESYTEMSNVSATEEIDNLQQTMRIFLDSGNLSDSVKYAYENMSSEKREDTYTWINLFLVYINEYSNRRNGTKLAPKKLDDFCIVDSFLCDRLCNVITFDVTPIMPKENKRFTPTYAEALLTINGFLILRSILPTTTMIINIEDAVNALRFYLIDQPENAKWRVLVV